MHTNRHTFVIQEAMIRALSLLALLAVRPVPAAANLFPKKVDSFDLCAPYAQYLGGPNYEGTTALTTPVWGGGCPADTVTELPVGFVTSICTASPYGGRAFTTYRMSTGGQTARKSSPPTTPIHPSMYNTTTPFSFLPSFHPLIPTPTHPPPPIHPPTESIVSSVNPTAEAAPTNQFQDPLTTLPIIGENFIAGQVQYLADEWCQGALGPTAGAPLPEETFACRGELQLRGNHPKNRNPGSALVYGYSATTTYAYVGSAYTTETQYGLGGANAGLGYVLSFYFNAYTVFNSITCQWAPNVTTTTPGFPYTGSGKFEKVPSRHVKQVSESVTRLDPYAVVANPASWYQNKPINYLSQFTLEYTKVGPDYSML